MVNISEISEKPRRRCSEFQKFPKEFEPGGTPSGGYAMLPVSTINGRAARAVTDLALAQSEGHSIRFYAMTATIEAGVFFSWSEEIVIDLPQKVGVLARGATDKTHTPLRH